MIDVLVDVTLVPPQFAVWSRIALPPDDPALNATVSEPFAGVTDVMVGAPGKPTGVKS